MLWVRFVFFFCIIKKILEISLFNEGSLLFFKQYNNQMYHLKSDYLF